MPRQIGNDKEPRRRTIERCDSRRGLARCAGGMRGMRRSAMSLFGRIIAKYQIKPFAGAVRGSIRAKPCHRKSRSQRCKRDEVELNLNACHSSRRATIGSTEAARRAGIYAAARLTAHRASTAKARASGSLGFIPKSMLWIRCATQNVIGRPTPTPSAASINVSRRMDASTCLLRAPRAMRIPIS
jgi:hypothetical protein